MDPFFSGIAIGIAIGIPIFLVCVLVGLALGVWSGLTNFIRSGEYQRAAQEGRVRAERIRAAGEARRQRDLAWMERHWATRWCAHLNRRIFG